MDRVVKETDQLHHAKLYAYDLVGNITAMTDPTGETSFKYDGMNRLLETKVKFTNTGGTLTDEKVTAYTYDANGNQLCYFCY